jgi:NAD(P)-dependent dehydrogenase (short-subunit alcohol dehydrogenase family)
MVTGGTRGIGRAIAVAFAHAGNDVVITGRTVREGTGRVPPRIRSGADVELAVTGSLESTAAEIAAAGTEPLSVTMNLAERDSVIEAAAQVLRTFGRIDVLVNNAIAHLPGSHDPLHALDTRTVEDAMRANFTHQLLLVQQIRPAMVERGSGVIVNVYSGSATTDPPGPSDAGGWGLAYSSSKAAFGRIAGAVNAEYRGRGVRAFNLDPGFVVTESGIVRGGTADTAARGFATASPDAAAAVAVYLATATDADRLLGRVIRAPKLAADLGLLD